MYKSRKRMLSLIGGAILALIVFFVMLWIRVDRAHSCVSNLMAIDCAKEQAAFAKGLTNGDAVDASLLDPYIEGGFKSLMCPAGGEYSVNPIGKDPRCSFEGHGFAPSDQEARD